MPGGEQTVKRVACGGGINKVPVSKKGYKKSLIFVDIIYSSLLIRTHVRVQIRFGYRFAKAGFTGKPFCREKQSVNITTL